MKRSLMFDSNDLFDNLTIFEATIEFKCKALIQKMLTSKVVRIRKCISQFRTY